MPNGDPQDGFFYPTLILMIDSYMLTSGMCLAQGPQPSNAIEAETRGPSVLS